MINAKPFLSGFKWMSILSKNEQVSDAEQGVDFYSFDLTNSNYDVEIEKAELDFGTFDIKFTPEDSQFAITGEMSMYLDSDINDEASSPRDVYGDQADVFLNDLREYLEKSYQIELELVEQEDKLVLKGKLLKDLTTMKVLDFDYIHREEDETEEESEGGMSKEEVIAYVESVGGCLKKYIRIGCGGGNPQFLVYVPEEVNETLFMANLFGLSLEEYQKDFG